MFITGITRFSCFVLVADASVLPPPTAPGAVAPRLLPLPPVAVTESLFTLAAIANLARDIPKRLLFTNAVPLVVWAALLPLGRRAQAPHQPPVYRTDRDKLGRDVLGVCPTFRLRWGNIRL